MAANYVLLERIELNASAASVTFSNIPQSGYTDLKMVVSARCDAAFERRVLQLQFNGATTNYSDRYVQGYNGATSSGTNTGGTYIELRDIDGATATANTFSNVEIYVPNYTSSNSKSVSTDGVTETNGALAMTAMTASLWASSAAITSVTLTPGNGNFVQYSTFSLYGLAATGTTPVIAPKASGGNITTDGTYWYHTFLTSGTFVPQTNLTCDALVVAGGGSGGNDAGGGGGAGGIIYFANNSLSLNTSYIVTVGAGGATSNTVSTAPSGSNSQFGSLTVAVGGGGSTTSGGSAASGGSGGGGGRNSYPTGGTTTQTGTGATSYYGNAGGTSTNSGFAAGGGGAGTAGSANSGTAAGAGGAGTSTFSTWGLATSTGQNVSGTVYFAGGGGGGNNGGGAGAGGNGGGGTGGANSNPGTGTAGTANTGGGGGGGGGGYGVTTNGGNGGSGIVIIRYAMA